MNSDQLKRNAAMVSAIFAALHDVQAPLDERITAVDGVLASLQTTKQEAAGKKLGVAK